MERHIITECYVDTMLVEIALSVANGCNHQKGCNNVAKIMQSKLQDKFAIGVIDNDKCKPSYFSEFHQIAANDNAAIKLYRHNKRNHYFIVICPAIEQFILTAAEQCNVSLTTYNLPEELNKFVKITKPETSRDNKDLRKLVRELKQHSENVCKLVQWIERLKANPYNLKIDLL
jgi:hypothetical protein